VFLTTATLECQRGRCKGGPPRCVSEHEGAVTIAASVQARLIRRRRSCRPDRGHCEVARRLAAGVLHGSTGGWQQPRPHLNSGDADGNRASQFPHLVQDVGAAPMSVLRRPSSRGRRPSPMSKSCAAPLAGNPCPQCRSGNWLPASFPQPRPTAQRPQRDNARGRRTSLCRVATG
jgi:hypothetical protein